MQPQRASRGIAAVALSSALAGFALLLLALLLTACGSASSGTPARTSAATSGSAAASAPVAGSASPSVSASPTTTAPATSAPASASGDAVDPTATVPTVPVTTAPAVPITAAAPAVGGGRITIGTITAIQGTAQLPGEIAGPALRVPVTIVNGTTTSLDLEQVVVDLVDSKGVSAGQLTADPAAPFTGTLAPRASASAVYVFSSAPDDRRDISISVSYTTAAPVVVFTGTIA